MVALRGYASPSRGASQPAVWREVAAMAEGRSAWDLLQDWGRRRAFICYDLRLACTVL
jgi:hypothetical protein